MNSKSKPLISTIILNWNRSDLLIKTLQSYIDTITVPYEIFIIDNASCDNSKEVIMKFCADNPYIKSIFLNKNIGGEAINIGLKKSIGRYLHISENDIEYLPGWVEEVLEAFESFPDLGQLSLFGPVPDDNEIWTVKPCVLKHSKGKIIYKALENVGTTSVIRREIWEKGIRISSINSKGNFLFPSDIKLSEDIKKLGYIVAWAKYNLVKNLGHSEYEFKHRTHYYIENYKSKSWLGVNGFKKRILEWESKPKPNRRSFLFQDDVIMAEKSLPTQECPEPQLWSMLDGWTAEIETLEFLYSLVRHIKPKFAIETGTWHGYGAEAIGRALKENGFGKLITIEKDQESYLIAKRRIIQKELEGFVNVVNLSSIDYVPERNIDFLLLDSDLKIRGAELKHFLHKLNPGAIIVFHDTNAEHKFVLKDINKFIKAGILEALFLRTPRGLALCQYKNKKNKRLSLWKFFKS